MKDVSIYDMQGNPEKRIALRDTREPMKDMLINEMQGNS